MTFSRRQTLALIGGGTILAAGTGVGVTLARTPEAALAPWSLAGTYPDPRMRALSYAILSPNPHNRQPWKVDLSVPGQAALHVDTDRLLPHTDPFSRQIVIGLGCFLETLRIAAAEEGIGVEADLFPEGSDPSALDARPVAICRFRDGAATPDPLFAQIMDRRSLKEPYDTARPVADETLEALRASVLYGTGIGTTNEAEQVDALRDLTRAAFVTEFETERTYKESVDLFRIGSREVNANPDGIDFSGPMWEGLRLAGLFTREAVLDRDGFSYAQGLELVQTNCMTGMAYVWQVTPGNSRQEQIDAGRDWMRLNLTTTKLGLGVQPMSQALQEFPEMRPHYEAAHAMLASGGETVQMLGRLGYGPTVPTSPRWKVEAKLMDG